MDWSRQIEQLEKNVIRYREVQHRTDPQPWIDNYRPISRAIIEDVLDSLRLNDCHIWIFRQPVSYMDGQQYNALTRRFENVEDLVNYFSCINDCNVGIFQIFGHRVTSPEFFQPTISIIARYATDFHNYPAPSKHKKISMSSVFNEFIKAEEMTI